MLWTRQFGTASDDDTVGPSGAVAADSTGVYVGGTTDGTLAGQTTAGNGDAFVRKYSPAGDIMWTRQFGSRRFDIALDLAPVGNSVYALGDTACRIDPGQTLLGVRDAFLMKVTANPTSLPGKIQLIVGRLETLSDAQTLGPQEFDSLTKFLEDALVALNQGSNPVAKQQLQAFVVEVEKLESQGGLPSAEAASLVAAANAVIGQL